MTKDTTVQQFLDCWQQIQRYFRRVGGVNRDKTQITRTQWFILMTLWRNEQCTIGQLAERLEVRPSTMSTMIDRLELAHLVSRFADAEDARTKNVRLTDEGKTLMKQAKSFWVDLIRNPFEQLAEEEQNMLVLLLNKLISNFPKRDES